MGNLSGEKLYDSNMRSGKPIIQCLICGAALRRAGSHISAIHGLNRDQYLLTTGAPLGTKLAASDVVDTRRFKTAAGLQRTRMAFAAYLRKLRTDPNTRKRHLNNARLASQVLKARCIAIKRTTPPTTERQPLTAADLKRMKRTPQAKIIRRALELTQEEFSARYHIPLGTLRDWEQGPRGT